MSLRTLSTAPLSWAARVHTAAAMPLRAAIARPAWQRGVRQVRTAHACPHPPYTLPLRR